MIPRYIDTAEKAREMMVWKGYELRMKPGRTYLENTEIEGWRRGPWYLSDRVIQELAQMGLEA